LEEVKAVGYQKTVLLEWEVGGVAFAVIALRFRRPCQRTDIQHYLLHKVCIYPSSFNFPYIKTSEVTQSV
jgi:hypothetical protein